MAKETTKYKDKKSRDTDLNVTSLQWELEAMVFTSFLGTFTVNTYYTEIRAACAVQTELLWSGCLLPDSWGAVRRSNANPGDSSFLPLLWGGSRDSIQVVRSPSLEYQMPSLLSYLPGPRQYLQNSYKNKRGG